MEIALPAGCAEPSREAWAAAIRSYGFVLDLGPDTGNPLQCLYFGVPAQITVTSEDSRVRVSASRDGAIHEAAASVAAGVLCAMTGGVLRIGNQDVPAGEALAWAREAEVRVKDTSTPDQEPIALAWRQKLAAFWAIAWLPWVASFTMMILGVSQISEDNASDEFLASAGAIVAMQWLVYFIGQGLLLPRLYRKRFRTFHIEAQDELGARRESLSWKELLTLVWPQILWPQFALMLASEALNFWFQSQGDVRAASAVASFSRLLHLFVAGPYAVQVALSVKYPGFRLQGYGQRFI